MDGTDEAKREARRHQPSPLMGEVEERLRAICIDGAEPWNAPIEERRATRRRDMEILRLAAMESALHTTEYIAGRLPVWKRDAFEHVRDPLASLANLNRSIVQITLAEDRFDETGEQRIARIKAEAEAKVKAEQAAEAERAYTANQIRRAETKRQVQGSVRAITLSSLNLPYRDREKLLAGLFAELEADDSYDRDPADIVADICVRLGIGPKRKGTDPAIILARKAEATALARAHIEALRGSHDLNTGDDRDFTAPHAPLVPPAQAQGPPD